MQCALHLVFLQRVFYIGNCGCCCNHLECIIRGMCIACSMHASTECTCLCILIQHIRSNLPFQYLQQPWTTNLFVLLFSTFLCASFIWIDHCVFLSMDAIGAVAVASAGENFCLLCFPSFYQVSTIKR